MTCTVVGINLGETSEGVHLMDGGAALVSDGHLTVAIAEERLSRKRYDGGFARSLSYCLDSQGLSIDDVDTFAFSICCDYPLSVERVKSVLRRHNTRIPDNKLLIVPSHHLSHAYAVYYSSCKDDGLIVVIDNEGNILSGREPKYFDNSLERISVYRAIGHDIQLVKRYHTDVHAHSVGSLYNAATRAIGYRSYQDAGKTMALAAYGEGLLQDVHFFDSEFRSAVPHNGSIVRNIYEMESLFLAGAGREMRKSTDLYAPSSDQVELAWLAQRELEDATFGMISALLKEYDVDTVFLTGGVGLNCVNNHKLLQRLPIANLVVRPASGDTGQCLGNAFYGYWMANRDKPKTYDMRTAYAGTVYSARDVDKALAVWGDKFDVHANALNQQIAELLAEGKVIALFLGGSEIGPRALGHRSVICHPACDRAKKRLDEVKKREYYRPYAPTVLAEYAANWFDGLTLDRFMLSATKVKASVQHVVPFVTHVDGTSRIQCLSKADEPTFHAIINAFHHITGIPMVLNTSFNRSGEPIVETPEDALRMFAETSIDFLVMEGRLVSKKGRCG